MEQLELSRDMPDSEILALIDDLIAETDPSRRMRFPDLRFRVFFFDHPPDGLPDPVAVAVRIDVEQIQLIALGVRMNIHDNAADRLAVGDDPKRIREFPVKALFYRLSINDAFLLRTEFLYRRLVESDLILPDKNLLFGFNQRSQFLKKLGTIDSTELEQFAEEMKAEKKR